MLFLQGYAFHRKGKSTRKPTATLQDGSNDHFIHIKTNCIMESNKNMEQTGAASAVLTEKKNESRKRDPNSVQQASGTIITTVKQGLLGGLGVEAIAGFSCAGKLSSLLMMPVFGFVQSTVFFIAQNTAALQPGRVKEGLREGRRILLVYSLGVVAVCIGLRGPLLRLFTTDPAAASYGCTMLAFESVTCLFVAQKHLFEARLRGAQKMGLYLASNLGQIALNLLACVILVPRIGFAGFWMSSWISAPIGMLLAAVLANLSGTSHQLP